MRLRAYAVTVLLTAFFGASAHATVLIQADNGGRMGEYASRFLQVRQSGERVVIDGMCLSACTMVLGLVPRDRICATSNAVLGFHAAWQPDSAGNRVTSAPATQALMDTYPGAVRAWIARNGGLTPRMIFLRGRALASIVAPCGSTTRQASAAHTHRGRGVRQVLRADLRRASIAAR
jgi:hypothetical protein